MKTTTMIFTPKMNFLPVILGTVGLLLIPLLAGWDWDETDYIVMGVLILGTGLVLEFIRTRIGDSNKRLLLAGVVLALFFLIWAELAVGLFGTLFSGN